MEGDKIEYVLNGIRDTWPDFSINEHKLRNPDFDLVVTFYVQFLEDFYGTLSEMCDNKFKFECPVMNNWDINNITLLFLLVRDIIESLNSSCFTLYDLIMPSKARTITMFQISLSLLFTLKTLKERGAEEISQVLKIREKYDTLVEQNAELETVRITLIDKKGELLAKLDYVKEEEKHAKELWSKHEEQKARDAEELQKLNEEVNVLQKSNQLKLQELHELQETEAKLRREVVSADEHDILLKTLDNLQSKYDRLRNEEAESLDTNRTVVNITENFVSLATELEVIDFSADLELLKKDEALDSQIQTLEKENGLYANQIKDLDETNTSLLKEIRMTEENNVRHVLKYKEIIKGLAADAARCAAEIDDSKLEVKNNQLEKENLKRLIKDVSLTCVRVLEKHDQTVESYQTYLNKILALNEEHNFAVDEYSDVSTFYR